jgi:transposase
MEYFAGLDVSMAETHVCVVSRNGTIIHKAKVPSTPADIAAVSIPSAPSSTH